ncbi:helix-turn-helix transcriptional regulator [Roseateles amylovorans]|uniref:Helix-turn-helix transcriptional regulator n=1 Tax=Roseateles amylovorans TaxID=2978473 RepID=A0ABY6B8R7_9BURK|nr:helix-turn-helix transcriptional regulator [Roseateles amylovorans]UXH79612.1 helix-turn-helix transcriptional regulator [Roseateles amylovorans]
MNLLSSLPPPELVADRQDAVPPDWLLDRLLAERLLEALWTARQPTTPAQFFVWSQSRMQPMLPHQLLVCVSESAPSARLSAQVFHLRPVPQALVSQLESPEHGLWLQLMRRWLPGRRALFIDLLGEAPAGVFQTLLDAGFRSVMVHGVPGPGERPEALFLLAGDGWPIDQVQQFELLVPAMHAAWRRARWSSRSPLAPQRMLDLVTPREQQIVEGMRAGLSNEGIAIQLGISMFTVKNHVRKILRKLGASNRAQAVAIAMTRREISEG